MADNYAIAPEFLKSYRDWSNQRYATTGIAPRPSDFQALAEANLSTQAANRYRDRSLQQGQQALDLQAQRDSAAARAATVSGVTGATTSAALTYGVGKELGWWGATTPAMGAAPAAGITTGAGVTEGGMAASMAAETGTVGAGATPGLLATAAPYAATAGAAYLGYHAGANIGGGRGSKVAGIAGSTAAGAALGTAILPGPGTLFGGAIGFIGGAIEAATDTIICSELHRQGLITERMRRYGMVFGKRVGEEVYQGYLIAAAPIVERMQRSKMFSKLVAFFAIPTIKEIAHRTNPREKGSILGAAVLHFGLPYCLRVFDERVDSCETEVA